jgi:long-subunit fatty acid transport protein
MKGRPTANFQVLGIFVVALLLIDRDVEAQQRSPGGSSTLLSANTGSGARALGMGGAFIAIADDATAASWNPAGLALLDRRQVSFVGDLTRIGESIPSYESTKVFATGLRVVESGPSISARRMSQSPEFANITYPVNIGRWTVVPQFSYRRAVRANFAGTTTQPYQYSESTGFRETGSDVRTFNGGGGIDVYAGAVGLSLTRMLDVGATINVWRGDSGGSDSRTISASFSLGGANGPLNPSGYRTTCTETFKGTSIDVGVLFKPVRRLRIGAIVKNTFALTRTYGYERQYTNWVGSISSETYGEMGTIDWPRSVGVGVAVTPFEAFTVSTDYTHSSWSKANYRFTSSDVQVSNGKSTTLERTGTVIYPDLYNPSAAVQPFFNVPQLDSSQLKGGAEVIWRRSDGGAFAGIPLRAGIYRNRSFLPQSNGNERVGTGVTAGTGVRWRQLNVDMAYVRESISGKTREFPLVALSGFSQSQQQGGRETTVLNRFLFSVAAKF